MFLAQDHQYKKKKKFMSTWIIHTFSNAAAFMYCQLFVVHTHIQFHTSTTDFL